MLHSITTIQVPLFCYNFLGDCILPLRRTFMRPFIGLYYVNGFNLVRIIGHGSLASVNFSDCFFHTGEIIITSGPITSNAKKNLRNVTQPNLIQITDAEGIIGVE